MTRKKTKRQSTARKSRQSLVFEELEPRLLLSADLPIDAPAVLAPDRGDDEPVSIYEEITSAAASEEQSATRELVFVDTDTPDYQTLVDDLVGNSGEDRLIEVVLLDNSSDGIAQLTDTLSLYNELDAVHIISHGSEGTIDLGGTQLEFNTLLGNTTSIQGWANAFSENGDLLIYGCNLAVSEDGRALVGSLARLTGTDVAASDDLTGSALLGGDWELEYKHGVIETGVAFSSQAQNNWSGVLATFVVDTVADTADANPGDGLAQDGSGNTSLRASIEEANALGGADSISLAAGTYTLNAGELLISSDITITGAGADQTFIDGNFLSRVLHIQGASTVTITDVTIRNGTISGGNGGAIWIDDPADNVTLERVILTNNTADTGGAIYNQGGTLTFTDGEISGNSAVGGGQSGGGLDNEGTAILDRVTISGNTASAGGGIYNGSASASLTMTNSTISGNSATNGGGLYTTNNAVLTNVTITLNNATNGTGGSGIHRAGGGGSVDLRNTIVAGNTGTEDMLGNGYTSLGHNLIGTPGNTTAFVDGVNGDQVGTSGSPLDPMLDPLADNGGFAQTHVLQTGSTAIDGGTNTGAPTTDQRGYIETDATMDIGAYQYGAVAPTDVSDAPTLVNNAGLTAAEGSTTVITNTQLRYTDGEQPASSIVYSVTSSPANGQLELTTNPGVAITSFTQAQIDAGEVVYVHDGSETPADSFGFTVDDGQDNYASGPSVVGIGTLTNVSSGISNARAPDYSPDGSKIVFARNNDIYIMDADGSNQTPLVTAAGGDFQAVWSPDGTRIAFTSNRDGNNEIYVIDVDGSNETRITSHAASDSAPAWSPDSSKIAFTSDRDGDKEIWVMDANGTNLVQLTSNTAVDGGASWSPDGSKIVFQSTRDGGDYEIYVMDADGSNQTRLTSELGIDALGDWSPDGSKLLFYSERDGNREIYVMDADGSNQVRLTTDAGIDMEAEWSPDGSSILFTSDRDGDYDVYSANVMYENTFAITVNNVNDAPVVTSGPETRSYKEDDPPIVVNPTLTVTDIDSANLTGATIQITTNYNSAQDVLAFTSQFGITGAWDSATGTLTLSGSATVAEYETVLRSVTYQNTSQAPTTSARMIEFIVSDGTDDSAPATKSVSIQSVFDRPETANVSASGPEDAASIAIILSGSDVDGTVDFFQLSNLPANGTLYLDAGLTQLAATGVDYTASSEQLTLYFVPDANWNGTTSFQYASKDDIGWTDDTPAAATLTVNAVNDDPVITSDGAGTTASVSVVENTSTVTTVTATDPDFDTPTFSITGGIDAGFFSIDANSGALTFDSAPNFENPADNNGDNVYIVEVTASDGQGGTDVQTISVTVTNVIELVVTNTNATGTGSLHEAILNANANTGVTDTITFNIPGAGPHVINLTGPLPAITDTVIIDGTTDPDYAGDPIIQIDGSSAGAGVDGLNFTSTSDGSEVKGLMITNFTRHGIQVDSGADGITIINNWIGTTGTGSVGDGNGNTGIYIQGANTVIGGTGANDGNVITNNSNEGINVTGAGATGTVIQGNIIGLDPDGATGSGNTDVGIALLSGANNTTIGGSTAAARNIISNNFEGIEINSNNNVVQGNYIGTDISGTLDLGNRSDDGIELQNGATGNLIGGSGAGEGNVISGNTQHGIHINNADGNTVEGNLIGTDATGSLDLGNGLTGIFVTNGAANNTIGGLTAADRNVIAGNGDDNIKIEATAGSGNTVIGNYIGVDAAGTAVLGNGGSGIDIQADGNTVGGTTAGARNIISGSLYNGVVVSGDNNTIQGNYIGTDVTGTVDLGNGRNGVWISGSTHNLVGGSDAGAGNLIYGNNRNGVLVSNGTPTGNTILGNSIYGNTWIGIDLSTATNGDDVTANDANDADSGPNALQNYPVITQADISGTDLTLSGSLDTDGSNTQYRIEFYGNAAGTQDATNGEGRIYLGSTTVTTDGSGDSTFSGVVLSGVTIVTGDFVTATATRIDLPGMVGIDDQAAYGSTSEFAANVAITTANTPPTTSGVADISINEDGGFSVIDLNAVFDDAEDPDSALVYTIINNTNPPLFDATTIDGSGALTLDYAANQNGAADITIRATDSGGLYVETTFTVTVNPVIDLTATDDSFSTNEDTALNADVSLNDSTTSGGTLTYALATGATNGSVVVNNDGTFTYTPTANYMGSDSFTYTVTDADSGESDTRTVNLTVNPVTDLTAADDSFSTNEDTVLNADVSTNDSTTSGGTLTYALASGAGNGSVSMNADGTFIYTPTANYTGSDSFTYTVTDSDSGESDTRTVSLTVDSVIDLTATDDNFSTNEDTVLNADVSTNDSTTSGGTLSYALATGATNGSVVVNNDGTFTYTPTSNYTGSDSFTYTVTDADSGESDTRTVNLTVNPVADLTATDDSFSTNEDTVLNADVSTNDSTTSGGTLTYALATGATNGTVSLNADGTFTYTPTADYTGPDSFTYTVTDADSGESDIRTVSLTINPVTDLTAIDDSFSTNEDTVLNADVSTNDSTTSGGTLSYALATGATNGSVSLNADGTFTYTPTSNYTGSDSFTYTVTDADSGESDTRTVNLTVDPVTDLTATDDAFSTNEDTVLNADVLTNDSTTSGGTLSYALATGASNGSVSLNADGTFSYTPTANYTGSDSFIYTVTDADSGESSTQTVTITVNPVTDLNTQDDAFSTNEDTALNADVSTNDSTTSGGTLTYALATGASNGSVSLNVDGTFTYTPTANYTGSDSFTYTVTDADSGETDTRTVNLTVNAVTDLTATDDSFSTNEDTVLNADVSTNDSTTSGGTLSYALATGASNGSVSLNADGTFSYTPTANYTGSDSFTYTVTDADSGESSTQTVTIAVDPVADLTAIDDSFSTNEDTVLNADVSTNDSTTSGGTLSYALATGASNGSVSLNADGNFTYTPTANYTGSDSFTYTVTDADSGESSIQTVTITVDPVADLTATDDSFSTNEDTVLNADVSTNDSTTSGGTLSYALATGATNGSVVVNTDGTFSYTPTANYTGPDSFTYTVTDANSGESDTRTVSLTVDPVTDLTATDDSFSTNEDTALNADVSTNDSTTSGGALTYALTTGAGNGTVSLNADGTFTYTPTSNYTGPDSFTYTVTDADSGESDTRTVSLTVDPVADLTATDDSFSTNEDTVLNADVSLNDSTTSGGTLSYALATGASNGSVSVNADGTFTYTPTSNYTGPDSFTYTVTDADSGESDTRTVNLTVNAVADLTATDDSFSTNEDTVLNADVSTNDSTTSGGTLTYALATGAGNGSVSMNADGTFTYTPTANYTGSDSFTYTVTDADSGESDTRTVNLTVNPVADLTAIDDSFSTIEDTVLNADVSTNDSTTSGGTLSYALATGASNGSVSLNADGTFTYTPTANYTGSDSFTYTVTDADSGESSTQTVTITVDPVTDLTAADDAFSTNEDTLLNADVSTNDSTTSGGTLTYALATGASNGSVSLNADGTFTYTPTTNYTGSDSFTYTVTDADSGETDTRTVNLTINPVTDLTATDDSFSTNEDTVLNADVSLNDSTTSGGTLTYALTTGAGNGTVSLNADGTFTYTPTANYTGPDSFTYTVTDADSGESSTQTVTITVDPVNDAPTAVNDAYTTNEDTPFTARLGVDALLQNDSDIDGDTLTVNTTPVVDVSNGILVLNADGTFTYTPTANFNGSDSFTYEVSDGNGGTAQATVTINVVPINDAPIAVNDNFTVNEGSTIQLNLAANDTDTDNGLDLTSITIVSGPSNGSIVVNGDGTVDYTHDGSETVADSFAYTINDASGATSAVGTVNLTIDPLNDGPIHSVPAGQSTSGTMPLIFSSLNGNAITVTDPDASGAPLEVTLSASNGTLSLAGTGGLNFSVGDGSSDTTMTVTGTAAAINAALNGLSFQADAGYEGIAVLQIITDDLGNVGSGGALNALDRVNIMVTAASAPAVITQDTPPTLDELILEDMLDPPALAPVPTPVNTVAPAAEEATAASSPATTQESGSLSTPASEPAIDVTPGSGRGIPTQADVSLPGMVELFDENLRPHDDNRPSSVRLIAHAVRQGLVDPFTYAKMLNPLQPDMAIWESIEAMMEQMDGRDTSWYSDDQVLTTTTATGLTVSFTVGYVSWLLRAGYLSASLMSVLPLWREFDPLPVLAATTRKKKRKSADDGKDSQQTNDIESESIFTSNETV